MLRLTLFFVWFSTIGCGVTPLGPSTPKPLLIESSAISSNEEENSTIPDPDTFLSAFLTKFSTSTSKKETESGKESIFGFQLPPVDESVIFASPNPEIDDVAQDRSFSNGSIFTALTNLDISIGSVFTALTNLNISIGTIFSALTSLLVILISLPFVKMLMWLLIGLGLVSGLSKLQTNQLIADRSDGSEWDGSDMYPFEGAIDGLIYNAKMFFGNSLKYFLGALGFDTSSSPGTLWKYSNPLLRQNQSEVNGNFNENPVPQVVSNEIGYNSSDSNQDGVSGGKNDGSDSSFKVTTDQNSQSTESGEQDTMNIMSTSSSSGTLWTYSNPLRQNQSEVNGNFNENSAHGQNSLLHVVSNETGNNSSDSNPEVIEDKNNESDSSFKETSEQNKSDEIVDDTTTNIAHQTESPDMVTEEHLTTRGLKTE